MKKFLLLFVGLCAAIPSFAVTYELNGGHFNPYDWASKDDMLAAFLADGDYTETPQKISYYQDLAKTEGQDGLHSGLCGIITQAVIVKTFYNDKWNWLYNYVHSIQTTLTTEKAKVESTEKADAVYSASWRYAIGAFFISGKSTSYPTSEDFAEAGKDENYFSAWGYNYGNPETVSVETTLLNPYMEGAEFQGWYDNAEFTGEKITTINASSTGTLYAKWSIVSYVTYELNGGVWNPDLWASKDDMLKAFIADGDSKKTPLTIAEYQAMVGKTDGTNTADGLHSTDVTIDGVKTNYPGLCTILTVSVVVNNFYTDKWSWLYDYVHAQQTSLTTDKATLDVNKNQEKAFWAYAIGAFFISGQSTSWPKSSSFAEAGKDENYFSAWGYSYGNPQSPINGFAPYKPFKWDNIFNGWYDNAEFSGDPVTSIPFGFHGTLYASWTRLSDVESPVVEQETLVNIYNISGTCVLQGVDPAEVNNLAPGFYIVGNKKVLVK